MKRKGYVIALSMLILAALLLPGCGSSSKKYDAAMAKSAYDVVAETTSAQAYYDEDVMPEAEYSHEGYEGKNFYALSGGSTSVESYSALLANRKAIFNGNVTIEVDDFDEAYGKINNLISGIGFVESSQVRSDKIHRKDDIYNVRRGVIVIRVMREKFSQIYHNVQSLGDTIEANQSMQDVTAQYFDVESRLKILRIEEDRLLSYLEGITDPETIFKYEGRLTEVRQEIERYTGTLRKWDDLVDLSTITINLREKEPEKIDDDDDEKPYGQKLIDGFMSSLKGVLSFLANFIAILVQAIPIIALLVLFGIVVYLPVRRFLKKQIKKKDEVQK